MKSSYKINFFQSCWESFCFHVMWCKSKSVASVTDLCCLPLITFFQSGSTNWSTHTEHCVFIQSISDFSDLFQNRQMRLDLLNTTVTRIHIAWVTLTQNNYWNSHPVGSGTPRAHAAKHETFRVTPDADWTLTAIPQMWFSCLLGGDGYTLETSRWSRSIIQGHYAKEWRRGVGRYLTEIN